MSSTSTGPDSRVEDYAIKEVEISLARSRADLHAAFRLLHHSYLRAGLDRKKPSGVRVTPYHLLPTTEVIVAKLRSEVISTVSLVTDGYMGVPMQSMYTREINSLRSRGLRVAEVGCLADRRESPRRFMELFVRKARLLAQVAKCRGVDALVAAVHPKHARYYKRALGFEQFGDLTECPYVEGNPAVAVMLEFAVHEGTKLYDQYFGDPYSEESLRAYHWDAETRKVYKRVLERDLRILSAASASIQGGIASSVVSGVLTQ